MAEFGERIFLVLIWCGDSIRVVLGLCLKLNPVRSKPQASPRANTSAAIHRLESEDVGNCFHCKALHWSFNAPPPTYRAKSVIRIIFEQCALIPRRRRLGGYWSCKPLSMAAMSIKKGKASKEKVPLAEPTV